MSTRLLRFLPPSLRFVCWVLAINLMAFTAARVAFWFVFHATGASESAGELAHSFYLGLKFDLRLALLIALPPVVLAALPPLRPSRSTFMRRLWMAYFIATFAIAVFFYLVDFGHYSYVGQRLNASLLEHLYPLGIAARMAWETYPIVWGLVLIALVAAGYGWLLGRVALPELAGGPSALKPWPRRGMIALLVVLYFFGLLGKISWYPLRWSDAFATQNEFAAELALNPILYFDDTLKNRRIDFDVKQVRKAYPLIAGMLHVDHPDAEHLNYDRWVDPRGNPGPAPAVPPNLVVIHLESFAGYRTGTFGNHLPSTPNFDALAREGLLFTDFFVPAVPSARSVFNMITGIPDLNPGRSASRNPLVVHQKTLINALNGYDRFYFIGGSATWGNIRGLLATNIQNLHIYEEGAYNAEHVDTWGASDMAVFHKAVQVFAAQKKPFFAFIQTSGNHRPYTIPTEPSDLRGFKRVSVDETTLHNNGFESLDAYNGIRYFDHCLGEFIREARKQPFFRNTIFVMYGDHGNSSVNPTPWQQLNLTSFHVPALFYAPALINPRRIDTIASELDLLPTALSMMKVPYLDTTLGRDLLTPRPASERFAMTPDGILDDEYLLHVWPRLGLFRYRTDHATEDVSKQHPQEVERLLTLRNAFVQTALYMMHHNPPRPNRPPPG